MFNLDLGSTGAAGPFLAWSAIGTRDGLVPARSFYIRDGGNKTPYDGDKGFVLDIDALKTGWQHSEGAVGVAPSWKWNESVSQMMAKRCSRNMGAGRGGSVAISGGSRASAGAAPRREEPADGSRG